MTEYNEVKIKRILNPTSIDLGEFVINPFMGCEFACLYCYVRSNRLISRKLKPWGDYVDIRINAPELLEKELALRKPQKVLLGSTTECFQPMERKYQITGRVLEILNKHRVSYAILTRSPDIVSYIPLLKEGFCREIYFTINNFSPEFKGALEPRSPAFQSRDNAVEALSAEGLPLIPYFSPVLPWISDVKGVFARFAKANTIEFECLNFRLANIDDIINNIALIDPALKVKYERMLSDKNFYTQIWQSIEKNIAAEAQATKKRYRIYVHAFGDYFKNKYRGDASLSLNPLDSLDRGDASLSLNPLDSLGL